MPQNIPTLPSGPTQRGSGTFGLVPTIPSLSGTQQSAITGNMGNLGNLYGLTNSLNTNIAQQAALPFNLNLPNYQGMVGQSSQNILQQLQGQVPQDVANQISQMAAERGVSTGSIGSPNANSALLRALGLTSLGLQQQGEQNLSGAIARTPTGQQFNPQSFLYTPAQQQEAQYAANLFGAAPTPGAGQQANLQSLLSGMSSYRGPGGGGGAAGQTDLLGFPVGNMSAYQNFGPTQVAYGPGGGPNQYGSTLTHSGGDFGASAPSQFGASSPWQYGDFEAMGFADDQSPLWGDIMGPG